MRASSLSLYRRRFLTGLKSRPIPSVATMAHPAAFVRPSEVPVQEEVGATPPQEWLHPQPPPYGAPSGPPPPPPPMAMHPPPPHPMYHAPPMPPMPPPMPMQAPRSRLPWQPQPQQPQMMWAPGSPTAPGVAMTEEQFVAERVREEAELRQRRLRLMFETALSIFLVVFVLPDVIDMTLRSYQIGEVLARAEGEDGDDN